MGPVSQEEVESQALGTQDKAEAVNVGQRAEQKPRAETHSMEGPDAHGTYFQTHLYDLTEVPRILGT